MVKVTPGKQNILERHFKRQTMRPRASIRAALIGRNALTKLCAIAKCLGIDDEFSPLLDRISVQRILMRQSRRDVDGYKWRRIVD
ncbi:uncharacterized protein MYCFIDRAFT_209626 [Pseudocercospora fijiensis CIRAD86]|uniref:Uncharacterized protein n=1 Tax=Pseudocercospora fijiensis (strain CIRAD86) TaxID=383855 RepID=N1QAA3_PSEFD|nr:uncharacterized protein MYCFIDRAFT_209626 [Pseudocercospora fijiensis CIRAD86]EME87843.1 hypothetical protein MYCFIDRAFT_209626 [Pseudocercospora fijiensis CIRAD86]